MCQPNSHLVRHCARVSPCGSLDILRCRAESSQTHAKIPYELPKKGSSSEEGDEGTSEERPSGSDKDEL